MYCFSLGPALYVSGVKTTDRYANIPWVIRVLYYPLLEWGGEPGFYDRYLRCWTSKNTLDGD